MFVKGDTSSKIIILGIYVSFRGWSSYEFWFIRSSTRCGMRLHRIKPDRIWTVAAKLKLREEILNWKPAPNPSYMAHWCFQQPPENSLDTSGSGKWEPPRTSKRENSSGLLSWSLACHVFPCRAFVTRARWPVATVNQGLDVSLKKTYFTCMISCHEDRFHSWSIRVKLFV